MATIAAEAPSLEGAADRSARARTALDILALPDAEPAWRALEADGWLSPYGRYDWVAAFAPAEPGEVRVALGRDEGGRPAWLLPIAVRRRFGLAIGGTVGGKHANYTVPLARNAAALPSPAAMRSALAKAGRRLGLDALSFGNVPVAWAGWANPLAAGGRPSASPAYSLALDRSPEDTFRRGMSAEARKKLRNKERGLAKHGAVDLIDGRDPASVDRILATYLRQKAKRLRELGLADPFAEPGLQAAIRRACAGADPAIELYALTVDDAVVATFGGAATRDRLSGMFVSFEDGPLARFSPGDQLVHRVIARQCERGRSTFDLGVGDARYKRNVCDGVDDLVDAVLPLTLGGVAFAAAARAAGSAKRRLKASPFAMTALAAARRRRARFAS